MAEQSPSGQLRLRRDESHWGDMAAMGVVSQAGPEGAPLLFNAKEQRYWDRSTARRNRSRTAAAAIRRRSATLLRRLCDSAVEDGVLRKVITRTSLDDVARVPASVRSDGSGAWGRVIWKGKADGCIVTG